MAIKAIFHTKLTCKSENENRENRAYIQFTCLFSSCMSSSDFCRNWRTNENNYVINLSKKENLFIIININLFKRAKQSHIAHTVTTKSYQYSGVSSTL